MVIRAILSVVLGLGVVVAAVAGAWAPLPAGVASGAPRPADAQPMIVKEVLSGDTVVLVNRRPGAYVQGWGNVTARLIGVDSPNFGLIDECYAIEAQGRLRELLPEGSTAWVATDATPRDLNGRWFMYVWTDDGQLVNYELAARGYVRAKPMPPSNEHFAAIEQGAEKAARLGAGLWSECLS